MFLNILKKTFFDNQIIDEQGRIHGNPVADGWAGAVMRKPLANQKSDRPTDLPTDTASSRVACPQLKSAILADMVSSTFSCYGPSLGPSFGHTDKPSYRRFVSN